MSDFFKELKQRGFIHQTTDDEKVKDIINGESINFYYGIDPTGPNLHIGHFASLMLVKKLIEKGHKCYFLFGGATSYVGDPSGKDSIRKMLSKEEIEKNIENLKKETRKLLKGDLEYVNNLEWLKDMSYLDFMRDIGIYFNVNKMLSSDCYANRIKEGGLTFLELGYMPMQAYDFYYLNKEKNCILQVGGSDQWGNIVAGVELNRRKNFVNKEEEKQFYALTMPLLLNHEGKKMGKTENGAVWLDENKTSVYDFYQYFYNVDDKDVKKLLLLFSDIDEKEIDKLIEKDIIKAKKEMAFKATKLVHGDNKARKAMETAKQLFEEKSVNNDAPSAHILKEDFEKYNNIIDFCVLVNLLDSKSKARRLIKQNGLELNGDKIKDLNYKLTFDDINKEGFILLKKGKKTFLKIIIK